ncbi:S1 family peptidase [Geodermatophilus sp. YIM 151500]|uniref:S1 family peptidase n=1 Tax=Geodermatophilus sp. YIM 151500 TaxID=2984531 RepID=UPI0021E38D69|nr:S1 family peptidase [Geodermatophilus sp. YIM 151500]MCV2490475.1 S1 family peptidase [Geodermatophilus sp. YIM 151500]
MELDSARELKARILDEVAAKAPLDPHAAAAGKGGGAVAVGLLPLAGGGARVAVRLAGDDDRARLPDLGRAADAELDVRVIGRVRALSSPGDNWSPDRLQRRTRPLRPGLSVAHPTVTAGTLGGFVRVGGSLAVLSNNHVLAASDAATVGDPVLQPGPADGGTAADRIATLTRFVRLVAEGANVVDAAIAVLDDDDARPGLLPGGPLTGPVPDGLDVEPDEAVEKLGRTTGHTVGRVTAVEVDGLSVVYDDPAGSPAGRVLRFDDQVEVTGEGTAFSAGGDSGSVIWRSADRGPLGLLFAGSSTGGPGGAGVTFAAPMATVLTTLDAEWVPE